MESIRDRLTEVIKRYADGKSAVFASKIGVPQSTFQNYARGERLPNMDTMVRIRDTFGIDLNWLLTGKGDSMAANNPGIYSSGSGSIGINHNTISVVNGNTKKTERADQRGDRSLEGFRLLTDIIGSGNDDLISLAVTQLAGIAQIAQKQKGA